MPHIAGPLATIGAVDGPCGVPTVPMLLITEASARCWAPIAHPVAVVLSATCASSAAPVVTPLYTATHEWVRVPPATETRNDTKPKMSPACTGTAYTFRVVTLGMELPTISRLLMVRRNGGVGDPSSSHSSSLSGYRPEARSAMWSSSPSERSSCAGQK